MSASMPRCRRAGSAICRSCRAPSAIRHRRPAGLLDPPAAAAELLNKAERPVVMVGRSSRIEAWARRVQLAEALDATVLTDPEDRSHFPDGAPAARPARRQRAQRRGLRAAARGRCDPQPRLGRSRRRAQDRLWRRRDHGKGDPRLARPPATQRLEHGLPAGRRRPTSTWRSHPISRSPRCCCSSSRARRILPLHRSRQPPPRHQKTSSPRFPVAGRCARRLAAAPPVRSARRSPGAATWETAHPLDMLGGDGGGGIGGGRGCGRRGAGLARQRPPAVRGAG